MTTLTLTTVHTPAGPVLAPAGELDHESSDGFRTAVAAITLRPGQVLTLDLGGLTFCDSSGITALIVARNHAHSQGAGIALTATPAKIVRVLRVLGLDQILPLPADRQAPNPPATTEGRHRESG
jgi:anti-sigma B factor antagonist